MENESTIKLMNIVKDLVPHNVSFVDELSDLLGISNDSVYRRMRGETSLTIDEVRIICQTFKISFDSFINNNQTSVTFDYNNLFNSEGGFEIYLNSILKDTKKILAAKNKNIIYTAKDLPIFSNFRFNELASFKLFYWLRSVIDVPSLQGKKYDPKLVSENLLSIGRELYLTYSKVPSEEVWCEGSLVSLFKQIEYYWDSGLFADKNDAILLCEVVKEQFDIIQKQAEASSKIISENKIPKEFENNFKLYYSEIEIGNNCILVNIEDHLTVYLTHNTFNKLITSNLSFCKETEQWLNNLMKKSTLISGVSEKYRYQFFKKAYDLLGTLINKINLSK
jgi:hypothetical protein